MSEPIVAVVHRFKVGDIVRYANGTGTYTVTELIGSINDPRYRLLTGFGQAWPAAVAESRLVEVDQ